MSDDIYDALWELEWIQIPGEDYVMKYKFWDESYAILITNLSEIYGEKLDEDGVQERFSLYNPYTEMKPKVIISKVKQALLKSLSGEDSELKMQCFPENLTLRLQFDVSQVSFIFDLQPQMLPAGNLRAHVVAPTVIAALLTFQENKELKKKIEDMEKKITPLATNSKPDQKAKAVLSALNKKSKMNAADILESFLNAQNGITKYITESKDCVENDVPSETPETAALQQSDVLLPQKRGADSEDGPATVIKYEEAKRIKKDDSRNPTTAPPPDPEPRPPIKVHVTVKKKRTFLF